MVTQITFCCVGWVRDQLENCRNPLHRCTDRPYHRLPKEAQAGHTLKCEPAGDSPLHMVQGT